MSNGGLRYFFTEHGLYRTEPPRFFPECTAVTLRNARDESASGPGGIITKLHVTSGQAPDRQLKRASADSESGNSHLVHHVDEALEHCKIRRATNKAPHVPIAGTAARSIFHEKVQVGLLFLDDIIELRAMEIFPENSLLPPVHSKNP